MAGGFRPLVPPVTSCRCSHFPLTPPGYLPFFTMDAQTSQHPRPCPRVFLMLSSCLRVLHPPAPDPLSSFYPNEPPGIPLFVPQFGAPPTQQMSQDVLQEGQLKCHLQFSFHMKCVALMSPSCTRLFYEQCVGRRTCIVSVAFPAVILEEY